MSRQESIETTTSYQTLDHFDGPPTPRLHPILSIPSLTSPAFYTPPVSSQTNTTYAPARVSLFVTRPIEMPGSTTPPAPPPKPAHLRLLAFPRLSAQEAAEHVRHASERSNMGEGGSVPPTTPRTRVHGRGNEEENKGLKLDRNRVRNEEDLGVDELGIGTEGGGGEEGFDMGHNASGAWSAAGKPTWEVGTVRTVVRGDVPGGPREARTLYAFDGEGDNELSFAANTSLLIHNSSVGEGWALASIPRTGEVGLCPAEYFVYTAGFTLSPNVCGHPSITSTESNGSRSEDGGGGGGVSWGGGPPSSTDSGPGSGFVDPTPHGAGALEKLRRSVMGEKALNRFSAYVTSGAEDWILRGNTGMLNENAKSNQNYNPYARHIRFTSIISASSVENPEANRFMIESGPSWSVRTPAFKVYVHSPKKRKSLGGLSEHVIYQVTSVFEKEEPSKRLSLSECDASTYSFDPEHEIDVEAERNSTNEPPTLNVERRFSHFDRLSRILIETYSPLAIPPMPEKQFAGRFTDDFVEGRRSELQRWLSWIVAHPLLRCTAVVMSFLSTASDDGWLWPVSPPAILKTSPASSSSFTSSSSYSPSSHFTIPPHSSALVPSSFSFYSNVWHPEFNLDYEDALLALTSFEKHVSSLEKLIRPLRDITLRHREAIRELSDTHRHFSYALLSVLSGRSMGIPADRVPGVGVVDRVPSGFGVGRNNGAVNKNGVWCWREECGGSCAGATRGLRDAADALQLVADIEDAHARKVLLEVDNGLKDLSHPLALYAGVIETGRATLARYGEAIVSSENTHAATCPSSLTSSSLTSSSSSSSPSQPSSSTSPNLSLATHTADANDALASRCETVLNVTLAEIDRFHQIKTPKLVSVVQTFLNSEIARHEAALDRLRAAREGLDVVPTLEGFEPNLNVQSSGGDADKEARGGTGGGGRGGADKSHRCWPSVYESELARPHQAAALPKGLGHPWDGRALRPVNTAANTLADSVAAIWEGVGGRSFELW